MGIKSKRFWYLLFFGITISLCSEQRWFATSKVTLPQLAGDWKIEAPPTCARPVPANLRPWRGTAGALQVCSAKYSGSPEMTFTIYDMPESVGATAFDAFQKWQRLTGKMAFYKGRYFGVVESPRADLNTLNRFAAAVVATLPPGAE
jgi:hypothetical protein